MLQAASLAQQALWGRRGTRVIMPNKLLYLVFVVIVQGSRLSVVVAVRRLFGSWACDCRGGLASRGQCVAVVAATRGLFRSVAAAASSSLSSVVVLVVAGAEAFAGPPRGVRGAGCCHPC